MKLTNVVKDYIINKAKKDAKEKLRFDEQLDSTIARIRQEYMKTLPEGIDNYKGWLKTTLEIYLLHPTGTQMKLCGATYACCKTGWIPRQNDYYATLTLTPDLIERVENINKMHSELKEFGEALVSVMTSCTTLKQLKETAPELEKYFPEEKQNTALVDMATVTKLRDMLGGLK